VKQQDPRARRDRRLSPQRSEFHPISMVRLTYHFVCFSFIFSHHVENKGNFVLSDACMCIEFSRLVSHFWRSDHSVIDNVDVHRKLLRCSG
jgi:hypothetical protein